MSTEVNLKGKTFDIKMESQDTINSVSFCVEYIAFYAECFGKRGYVNGTWFKWYNIESPFGRSLIYTARESQSGMIVCSYCLTPYRFKIGQALVEGYLCVNGMTKPGFEGLGLFTSIGKFALGKQIREGEIVIGFPNENAIKSHIKVGWQVMPNLKFIEKRSADFTFRKTKTLITDDLNQLRTFNFESANAHSEFQIKKDFEFIRWRYIKNPKYSYKLLTSSNAGTIESYAIIKVFHDESSSLCKVHILEFACYDLEQLHELINGIENFAISIKADLINLWDFCLQESKTLQIFIANKFKETEYFNRLIIYSSNKYSTNDHRNWQIMLGDNDVF